MDPMLLKSYSFQLEGVLFCHNSRVFHRDLKPENLLIDEKGSLKIADFGLSRAIDIPVRDYTHEVLTLWYKAPEVLLGSRWYSLPIDVWSIACIIAEMVTKKPLFPGDSEIDELFKIFKIMGTPNDATWPGVSELPDYKPTFPQWSPQPLSTILPQLPHDGVKMLQTMLVYNPAERMSTKVAVNHPFFNDLDRSTLPSAGFTDMLSCIDCYVYVWI